MICFHMCFFSYNTALSPQLRRLSNGRAKAIVFAFFQAKSDKFPMEGKGPQAR